MFRHTEILSRFIINYPSRTQYLNYFESYHETRHVFLSFTRIQITGPQFNNCISRLSISGKNGNWHRKWEPYFPLSNCALQL